MAPIRHVYFLAVLSVFALCGPAGAVAGASPELLGAPGASPAGNEAKHSVELQTAASAPAAAPELDYDPLFDDEEAPGAPEVYDPFESGNRAVYAFNQRVAKVFWRPLTAAYRFAVPSPARRAVRRVFDNLNAPIYFANHVLQLEPLAAIETLGAFTINSLWGIGGMLDAASAARLELHPTDFGQTLARAGIGSGPYLMFPFLGPTTLRDGIGFVIDRGFHPATYFFAIPVQLMGYAGVGFASLEEAHDQLSALEASALDPYAVLRSAYMQQRERSIAALIERAERPADIETSRPGTSAAPVAAASPSAG